MAYPLQRALDDLRSEKGIALDLVDMQIEEGGTYLIHPKMYGAIETSEIVIIDLTGLRPNVCIEAGYALKHHDTGRLIFLFQPSESAESIPFDLKPFKYRPIAEAADIPAAITPDILAIMKAAAG